VSPGRIDATRLRRHLVALDEILSRLAPHAGRDARVLAENSDERWSVERGLQLCTQSVLDIATHLVAAAGRDAPDYATAIDTLGELNILTPEFAARLRPLAGFRNALVHGYLQIDVDRLHAVLNEHLDDVREFARCVNAFVCKQE
jgi:uncharacterized protein YutE (UPF0331/DUF86 family)